MKLSRLLASPVSGLAILALAACGGGKSDAPAESQAAAPAQDDIQCVQLEPGTYYWDGTGFAVRAVPQADEMPQPSPAEQRRAQAGWAAGLERGFPDLGFPWMGLRAEGPVAVLTGIAPDESAKESGYTSGMRAVKETPAGAHIGLVVDGIAVEEEGAVAGPGDDLAALMETEISPEACEAAFSDTLADRTILFQSNLAIVSPTSDRLLDALTGIALLCDDYGIEIGGHTDSRGSDEYNEIISQQRADAVRAYMIDKGVNPDALTAKGYGESRPLDSAETYEAWAKNRRMEFKVSERR